MTKMKTIQSTPTRERLQGTKGKAAGVPPGFAFWFL